MKTLNTKHNVITYEIDKDSIKNFFLLEEERRDLRQGKVKNIVSLLLSGEHFESALVVNKVNGFFRVIDGNHRIEAIKEVLERDPEFSIKVYLAKYENLSQVSEKDIRQEKIRSEERKIYSRWNKGTPENATDYLKQHFKIVPRGEEMLRKLPVTIYGTSDKMKIKLIVGSHIDSKRQGMFNGSYGGGGEKLVKNFCEVTSEDIKVMLAFYKDYSEVFGVYSKDSPYYRTSAFTAMYRIWFDNRQIPREKLINAFKNVILKRWAGSFDEWSKHGGGSAAKSFYKHVIEELNDYRKKLVFLCDRDILKFKSIETLTVENDLEDEESEED